MPSEITLDEFIEWMESKGSRGDLATKAFKYWRNKYYEEIDIKPLKERKI